MIKNNIIKLLSLVFLFAIVSCDYNKIPAPNPKEDSNTVINVQPTHTIAQLKAMYQEGGVEITDDVILKVQITSDDTEGNFYKNCYVQDETGAIELKLGMSNISSVYPQGSYLLIYAKGMSLGKYFDDFNLGYRASDPKYETAFYPEKLVDKVLKFVEKSSIKPRLCAYEDLNKSMIGELVTVKDVQFEGNLDNVTYAYADKSQKYRTLGLVTKDGKKLEVRTSSYARFAGSPVAKGSGSITGILKYFQSTPQIVIIKQKGVNLDNPRF